MAFDATGYSEMKPLGDISESDDHNNILEWFPGATPVEIVMLLLIMTNGDNITVFARQVLLGNPFFQAFIPNGRDLPPQPCTVLPGPKILI